MVVPVAPPMKPCVALAPINDCAALDPSVETSVAATPVAVVQPTAPAEPPTPPVVPPVPPIPPLLSGCALAADARDRRTKAVAKNRNEVIMVMSLLVSDG